VHELITLIVKCEDMEQFLFMYILNLAACMVSCIELRQTLTKPPSNTCQHTFDFESVYCNTVLWDQ